MPVTLGAKYGRLVVVLKGAMVKGRQTWWCDCDCGSPRKALASTKLVTGNTRSCGCLARELAARRLRTHGQCGVRVDGNPVRTKSKTYNIWSGMIKRCVNPKHKNYSRYGGRGICVCGEWRYFENFLRDMGEAGEGLCIERVNNDGHYEPSNCRWATQKEQTRNTSANTLLTHDGKTMPLVVWAEEYGIRPTTLSRRVRLGWRHSAAITTPAGVRPGPKSKTLYREVAE